MPPRSATSAGRPYLAQFTAVFGNVVLDRSGADAGFDRRGDRRLRDPKTATSALQQQVRCVPERQRDADAGRAERPAALQRPEQGQLQRLPPVDRRGRRAAAVHRLHLRQRRHPAQLEHRRPTRRHDAARTSRRTGLPSATRATTTTTTWACAARCEPTSPTARRCAASSRCRRCATSRSSRTTSTTASSTNLNDVVSWYVTRDTDPARWYRKADGSVDVPYNDLPQRYHFGINTAEVPYNPGLAPMLTSDEIKLIVVFLCTLSDGYDPNNPTAYASQAQCQQAAAAAH